MPRNETLRIGAIAPIIPTTSKFFDSRIHV